MNQMFSQGTFSSNSYSPFDEMMPNMHYGFSPVNHMNNSLFDNSLNPLNNLINIDGNFKILGDEEISHNKVDEMNFINSVDDISLPYNQPYNSINNNWLAQDNVGQQTIFTSNKLRSSFYAPETEIEIDSNALNSSYDKASIQPNADKIFPSVTACTPPPGAPSVLSMTPQNAISSAAMSVTNSANKSHNSTLSTNLSPMVVASQINKEHNSDDMYYRRDSIESVFDSHFGSLQQNISQTINQNNSDDLMYFYNNNVDSKQIDSGSLKFENALLENERTEVKYEDDNYEDEIDEDVTTFIDEDTTNIKVKTENILSTSALEQEEESNEYFLGRYPVVRGITAGGSVTKPPNVEESDGQEDFKFVKAKLSIKNGEVSNIGGDSWSQAELKDKRRIFRIERRQRGPEIEASFHIVGAAEENVEPVPSDDPNVDVVEISCLECLSYKRIDDGNNLSTSRKRGSSYLDDDNDALMDEDEGSQSDSTSFDSPSSSSSLENYKLTKEYYITSVEVIKIVELLISTEGLNPADCRRERGRIRSNLVPFWSKKSIKSKKTATSTPGSSTGMNSPSPSTSSYTDVAKSNSEFRDQLAQRIMGYKIRKPRGFDKEVRILKWENLVSALERALQSYYVQLPSDPKNW